MSIREDLITWLKDQRSTSSFFDPSGSMTPEQITAAMQSSEKALDDSRFNLYLFKFKN